MEDLSPRAVAADFPSTHWSIVLEAADPAHPRACTALRSLLTRYWRPLLAYLRHPRWSLTPDDALDVVQQFCLHVLERPGFLAGVDVSRGRFRHYIQGALNHFMLDQVRAERAMKRGGGRSLVTIDSTTAESFHELACDSASPDELLQHSWALTVLEAAMEHLRSELEGSGKLAYYHVFRLAVDQTLSYREIAVQLDLSEQDVANYLHRARRHFARALTAVVLPTVEHPGEARDEIRDLMHLLSVR